MRKRCFPIGKMKRGKKRCKLFQYTYLWSLRNLSKTIFGVPQTIAGVFFRSNTLYLMASSDMPGASPLV